MGLNVFHHNLVHRLVIVWTKWKSLKWGFLQILARYCFFVYGKFMRQFFVVMKMAQSSSHLFNEALLLLVLLLSKMEFPSSLLLTELCILFDIGRYYMIRRGREG